MSVFYLKIIALTTMIIDHLGAVFFPNILIFRYIGRIAFPIYAFLISEGCKKTRDFTGYLKRLFIFAILSEPFYDLIFFNKINFFKNCNTIFTLFFASLIIYFFKEDYYEKFKYIFTILVLFLVKTIGTDYGIFGVILVLTFYFAKTKNKSIIYASFLILFFKNIDIFFLFNYINFYAIFDNLIFSIMTLLPLYFIYLYNGEKGLSLKYTFYFAYPLHFLIILIIKFLLN